MKLMAERPAWQMVLRSVLVTVLFLPRTRCNLDHETFCGESSAIGPESSSRHSAMSLLLAPEASSVHSKAFHAPPRAAAGGHAHALQG